MELKLGTAMLKEAQIGLLIVPYGIEMILFSYVFTGLFSLLIVPYGIEIE